MEVITWKNNGVPCNPPKVMRGMGHSYTISVHILSTNTLVNIINDLTDGGVVFMEPRERHSTRFEDKNYHSLNEVRK